MLERKVCWSGDVLVCACRFHILILAYGGGWVGECLMCQLFSGLPTYTVFVNNFQLIV